MFNRSNVRTLMSFSRPAAVMLAAMTLLPVAVPAAAATPEVREARHTVRQANTTIRQAEQRVDAARARLDEARAALAVVLAEPVEAPQLDARSTAAVVRVDRAEEYLAAAEASLRKAARTSDRAHQRLNRVKAKAARIRNDRQRLVRVARGKLGSSYVAGASGPNAFDCSGFTMWVYQRALGKALPHYSGAQMQQARRVHGKLKPGDLLFYGPGGSQHVSMYVGGGKQIHATNPRDGVIVDSIREPWWRNIYAGAGRVVGD